jgi:hypothetical protein
LRERAGVRVQEALPLTLTYERRGGEGILFVGFEPTRIETPRLQARVL